LIIFKFKNGDKAEDLIDYKWGRISKAGKLEIRDEWAKKIFLPFDFSLNGGLLGGEAPKQNYGKIKPKD